MPNIKMIPALPYALALVAGLVCGYYCAPLRAILLLAVIVLCLLCGWLLKKNYKYRTIPFIAAFVFVGMLFMNHAREDKKVLPAEKVNITAVVTEMPKKTDKGYSCEMYIIDGPMKDSSIRVTVYEEENKETPIQLGSCYTFQTRLRPFRNFPNSGNFNYERWAECRGLDASAFVNEKGLHELSYSKSLPYNIRIPLKAKILRQRVLGLFDEGGVENRDYAIMAAMAFGDKSALDHETRDIYARTGASHLLALSGMHLGILFVLLSMIFIHSRRELVGRSVVLVSLWLYVLFVGMPASVVRAAIMLTIYTLVTMDGRDKMSINALCVTAMVMLLVNPMSIWDVGFQLSFMAMLSIFIFFTPIYNIIRVEFLFHHPLLRKIWGMLAVSIAAQIGTAPLTMYYFGRFSTCFLITNLVAVPLVMVLLYAVFFAVLLSFVPMLKMLFLGVAKYAAMLLNGFLFRLSDVSGVSIEKISINWVQLMLIYAMIVVVATLLFRLRPKRHTTQY